MAIELSGQYRFEFSMGPLQDFIFEGNLVRFEINEQTGNYLPDFELVFDTAEDRVASIVNEGNDINVRLGKSTDDGLIDVKLVPANISSNKVGDGLRRYEITGLRGNLPYINNTKVFTTTVKSGIEALIEIGGRNFGVNNVDTNVTISTDSQRWIQPNITDKAFANNVWMHTDLGLTSYPAVAISVDGKFIIRDIRLLAAAKAKNPDFIFTDSPTNRRRAILYDGDYSLENESGFINHWMGYGRIKNILTMETGVEFQAFQEVTPHLSLLKNLVRRAELEKKHASMGIINDNVHVNYWNAFLRNLQSCAIFSSYPVNLSFHNLFQPIRVLDICTFNERDLEKKLISQSFSGLYLVSKVNRVLEHRQLVTTVQLVREAINYPAGTFRSQEIAPLA